MEHLRTYKIFKPIREILVQKFGVRVSFFPRSRHQQEEFFKELERKGLILKKNALQEGGVISGYFSWYHGTELSLSQRANLLALILKEIICYCRLSQAKQLILTMTNENLAIYRSLGIAFLQLDAAFKDARRLKNLPSYQQFYVAIEPSLTLLRKLEKLQEEELGLDDSFQDIALLMKGNALGRLGNVGGRNPHT